jgi:acyl-CoA reductase-like NAD-dependent aldehyde dehydrogenase
MAAKADVDAACAAARKAFDEGPWPRMTPQERQAVIANAVKLIEDRADLFKFLLKGETGQTAMVVDMMQYGAAVSGLQYYATAADKFTWRDVRDGIYGQTMVLREPVGVVGAWRRGTFHCSWRATSSARRCWPAARWCSSRRRRPR